MPFISSAIAAITAAGSIGAAIVGGAGIAATVINTALSLALSVGASALAAALGTKSAAAEPGEIAATLQVGGDIPRQVAFGRIAVRGQLAFAATNGIANERLLQVFILSDGWCDAIESVWIGDKHHELVPITPDFGAVAAYVITAYGDTGFGEQRATIWFYDGRPGQSPNALPNGYAPDRADPTDRFAGMAYVMVQLINNGDAFDSIPDLLFQMRGYRCHDPRKDAAFGGSGSHSLLDPATWEFTENPALHVLAYLRGVQSEGQVFMGMDLADYDLLTEQFVAAANICDEPVPLDAGGAEVRYRASSVLTAGDGEHRAALAPLIQALAGYLVERNGSFGLIAGAAQLPVVTITDDDFDWTRGVRWSGSKSRTNRVNEVHGQFVDPSAGWQANSYPPITSAVYSAEDGERLAVSLDFGCIASITQAQRVARARMRETRRQATGSGTLGMHLLWLEPGDWIRWTSATFDFNKLYRIVSRDLNPDDTSTVSLQEIGNEVYSWNAADEQPYLPPATGPTEPPLPSTVTNFNVQADVLTNEDTSTRPVLRLTWDPIDDIRIIAVVIEFRPIGMVAATRIRDDSPYDGLYVLDQPPTGQEYEFRATIATVPARPVSWTPWVQIATIEAARQLVDLEDLFGQARADVAAISAIGEGTLWGEVKKLNDKLEQIAADAATEAGNAYEKRELIKVVSEGGIAQAFAAIVREEFARVSADEATAEVSLALAARLEDAEGTLAADATAIQSLNTTVTAQGGALSSQSSAITSLSSRIGTAESAIGGQATATSQLTTRVGNAEGSISAQASSLSSLSSSVGSNTATLTTYGTSIDGIKVQYGIVGTINGATGGLVMNGVRRLDGTVQFNVEIVGNLVVDGTISGRKLQAYDIIANTAQIGALTVDTIAIRNGAISNSAAAFSGGQSAAVGLVVRDTGRVHVIVTFNGAPGYYVPLGTSPGVLRIYRDGSQIAAVTTAFETAGEGASRGLAVLPTTLQALDYPGAGYHTYTVYDDNGLSIGGVGIIATELSK